MQSYQELKVWQEAMNLAELSYKITLAFPKQETYGMISQIRRSAVSVPANNLEGYGRKTRKQYLQFLYIAQGSLKELETHFLLSVRVELASSQTITPALDLCGSVGRLLFLLIRALERGQ
jgi:four helix bundle protein